MLTAMASIALALASVGNVWPEGDFADEANVPRLAEKNFREIPIERAYHRTHGLRADISLDGFWDLSLADEVTERPGAAAAWLKVVVPSYWRGGGFSNYPRTSDGRALSKWHGRAFESYRQGWYRRTFVTPAACSHAQALLRFGAAYSQLVLCLNGRKVELPWSGPSFAARESPCFEVDVTRFLGPVGATNELLVGTASALGHVEWNRAGLQDDVWLRIRPTENFGRLRTVTLPSVGKLILSFAEGTRAPGSGGRLHFTLRDAKSGAVVQTFEHAYERRIEADVMVPKLWSVDSPNLYYLTCSLQVDGRELDREEVRLGFRELSTANGRIVLNGKPLQLNTQSAWQNMWQQLCWTEAEHSRSMIRFWKMLGVNSVYSHRMMSEAFYDVADEEGFICIERLDLRQDEFQGKTVDECRDIFRKLAVQSIRSGRTDNHPSVCAILTDFFFNSTHSVHNPAFVGLRRDSGRDPNMVGEGRVKSVKANAVADEAKAFFPDCEILAGCGGHTRDVYSAFIYQTWGAPYAELAAMFSAKDPTLPFYCGEYAVPYHGSFHHLNRWGRIRDRPEYSYWQENAARVLGPCAYAEKSAEVGFIWNGRNNSVLSATGACDGSDKSCRYEFLTELFQKTLADSLSRTVFHWRYDGLCGLAPFEYTGRYLTANLRPSHVAPQLKSDWSFPGAVEDSVAPDDHRAPYAVDADGMPRFRPTGVMVPFKAVYDKAICRFVDAGDDWYGNSHHGWSGETCRKAFAVVNDLSETLQGEVSVTLRDGTGGVLAETTFPMSVEAYSKRRCEFKFKLPSVSLRSDCVMKGVFRTRQGPRLEAAQNFEVFPRIAPLDLAVQVYGADADFLSALKTVGCRATVVRTFDDVRPGVLIVAPGALDGRERVPDFSAWTGKDIRTLVLEQRLCASRELKKARSRRAFVNAAEHPVLRTFRDVDFTDWTGASSVEPAGRKPDETDEWTDWGNRDMVAVNVFRRPMSGNFLSLLTSGYDLYQSPLVEYCGALGSWLGSQLEIGSRLGTDPVATTLFANMVAYLSSGRRSAARVGYYGGERGRALLKKNRFSFAEVGSLTGRSLSEIDTLVVSDPDWRSLEASSLALCAFVHDGGTVLYLQGGDDWSGAWLPFALEMSKAKACDKAVCRGAPDAVWMNGWNSDLLYWRGRRDVPCFANFPATAKFTDPAVALQVKYGCGRYVFASVTPETFADDQHHPSHRLARFLAALATSCGVRCEESTSPYEVDMGCDLGIVNRLWEFAEDPSDIGMSEGCADGRNGSLDWLKGQVTLGGDRVRCGIGCERFLGHAPSSVCWYRLKFRLAPGTKRSGFRLNLGNVGGSFGAFVNGRPVGGEVRPDTRRWLAVSDDCLVVGENVLVVRIAGCREKNGGLYDGWALKLTNAAENPKFWFNPYPGNDWEYYYNPDWVRQY